MRSSVFDYLTYVPSLLVKFRPQGQDSVNYRGTIIGWGMSAALLWGCCRAPAGSDGETLLRSLVLHGARQVHFKATAKTAEAQFFMIAPFPATGVLKHYDRATHEMGMTTYQPRATPFCGLRKWVNGEVGLPGKKEVWSHILDAHWAFTNSAGERRQLVLTLGYISPVPTYYIDSMPEPTSDALRVDLIVRPLLPAYDMLPTDDMPGPRKREGESRGR